MASSKQSQLDDIQQQILDDDPSPELRQGATQLVFGDGNPGGSFGVYHLWITRTNVLR